jgi:hypothetical protein
MNIAWILGGTRKTASSRLQGYLIHDEFLRMGVRSNLIADNFINCKSSLSSQFLTAATKIFRGQYTHVIFEGPEWISTQLAILVRSKGIVCICVRCDRYPFEYDRYFDLTILPTETLRDELVIQQAKIIPDMVEVPIDKYKKSYTQIAADRVTVGWLGHQNYGPFIFDFIEKLQLNVIIRSNFVFDTISIGPRFARQWSEESIMDDLLACDLVMIPIPEGDWYRSKSANRLTMMLALGMPCVATAIPSYRSIGVQDENVIFAGSLDEFIASLIKLSDPHLRERLGNNARRSLTREFSQGEVAKQWLMAIQDAERQNIEAADLKVQCLALLLTVVSRVIR